MGRDKKMACILNEEMSKSKISLNEDWFQDDKFIVDEPIVEDNIITSSDVPANSSDTGISNILIDAINSTFSNIKLYNSIIEQMRYEEEEESIPIIEDVIKNENINVGKLQSVLEVFSPTTENIDVGKDDASAVLGDKEFTKDRLESINSSFDKLFKNIRN